MIQPLTNMARPGRMPDQAGLPSALGDLCDYLYLVADCLTVIFLESESLGLNDRALLETANRYLSEAQSCLRSMPAFREGYPVPTRVTARNDIQTTAAQLHEQARFLESTLLNTGTQ